MIIIESRRSTSRDWRLGGNAENFRVWFRQRGTATWRAQMVIHITACASMSSRSSPRPRTSLQCAPLPHRRERRRSGWHWYIQPPARRLWRRARSNPLHRDTPFSTSLHPLASPCCFISQRSCSYTTHHHACTSSYAVRLFCGGVRLTASTSAGGNSVPHTPGSNSGTCGRLDQGLSRLEVSGIT